MSFGLVEAVLVSYLVVGTFLLKAWNNGIDHTVMASRILFILGSILISVLPIIVLQANDELRSAVGVVLSGIIAVWFALICSREPKREGSGESKPNETEAGI